jgi:hypothetical protein
MDPLIYFHLLFRYSIPGFQNQATGAVSAVLLSFLFLKDPKGFIGENRTINTLWVENVAKVVTGETVTFGIRDKFDTKRIKQSLPAEHEQSRGGQSDELGKEAVK